MFVFAAVRAILKGWSLLLKRKNWALQIGYDLGTDLPFGFKLFLGARNAEYRGEPVYRLCLQIAFDWPKVVWRDNWWAINEEGMLKGLPIARQSIGTGRRYSIRMIVWPRLLTLMMYPKFFTYMRTLEERIR